MDIINFIDFSYILEHENECFEFEFEEEFLENIAEELNVEDFDIIKIEKISEKDFNITVSADGKEGQFKYTLSDDKIKYIQSVTE